MEWVSEKDNIQFCDYCKEMFIGDHENECSAQETCQFCNKTFAKNENHSSTCLNDFNEWPEDHIIEQLARTVETRKICSFCNEIMDNSEHENVCVFDPEGWPDIEIESSENESFEVMSRSEKRIRKFGIVGKKITFNIKPVPSNEDPILWIQKSLQGILTELMEGSNPTDQVGFCIYSEQLKEPVWCSFKAVKDVRPFDIWEMLEKVIQSNQLVLHNVTFTIEATRVRIPYGSGRRRYREKNFQTECLKRRGIVSIDNSDNNCLPRALIVGKAIADRDPKYLKIKNNVGNIQTRLTVRLIKQSKVVIPQTGASMAEVATLQKYLKEYTITVYEYGNRGRTVLFKGPDSDNKLKINLLFHDNHFNVIRSLTAAFACSYYCEECNIPYEHKYTHKCDKICLFCKCSPKCEAGQKQKCSLCNRLFQNKTCFDNHLAGSSKSASLCERLVKCRDCYSLYWLNDSKRKGAHVCGEIYCSVCDLITTPNHTCYVARDTGKPKTKGVLFLFYDIETYQETEMPGRPGAFQHQPNLCVIQQVCLECEQDTNMKKFCSKCGIREHVFYSTNCIKQFLEYAFLDRPEFKHVICIAHNAQGFDAQFVLKSMVDDFKVTPQVILRGSKILLIQSGNVRFLDSFSYIPMSLAKFPKTFGLEESKKGYFPYYFNKAENQSYVGKMPDIKFYGCSAMRNDERVNFIEWYDKQISENIIFDMSKEIVAYCINDVQILRQACLAFRKMYIEHCNVCPFSEGAITLASAVSLTYRRNHLPRESIAIVPRGGYRMADRQSFIAIKWLLTIEKERNIFIKHAGNGREYIVPNTKLKVDGFCEETNEIFQFHGCYFHGHTCINFNRDKQLDQKHDTLNHRYQSTIEKTELLKALGYLVTEMWECDFKQTLKENKDKYEWLDSHPMNRHEPIQIRASLFGGRTEGLKRYYKAKEGEKIMYLDVTSLYPYICKYGIFPIKDPKIYIGHQNCTEFIGQDKHLKNIHGVIKCVVIPPKDLYHPVLPYRQNGKLNFTLCRTCSQISNKERCEHSDEDRQLLGTWVILELAKALEKGYVIREIVELYAWETVQYDKVKKTGGLFTEFINCFLKIKQEASGWPSECVTERDKRCYIENYRNVEGITLDYKNINKNEGLRALAKLNLNSFWGKHAQRTNLSKTNIVNSPSELLNMFVNPRIIVNHIQCANEDVVYVNWEFVEEFEDILKTGNIGIGAFVTAQARLKLYSYLEKLGDRILYYDTDSIIFIKSDGDDVVETGNYLGDLTDELTGFGSGSFISEFVCSAEKSYAYEVFTPSTGTYQTVCKVKGITLNYENSKLINFKKLKEMILNNNPNDFVTTSKVAIKRTNMHTVYSEVEEKKFKVNIMKRRLVGCYDSEPYGYKK